MSKLIMPIAAAAALLLPIAQTRADGTETLGAPSVAIQPGTSIIAAGTGLYSQPGTIQLAIPAGATVKQVLLYWDGAVYQGQTTDGTIRVNGVQVTGMHIGGPTGLFTDPSDQLVRYDSYRADITGLGLVHVGNNTLTIDGLSNSYANDGAGVLVVIQQGTGTADISVRDGIDWAYWKQTGNLAVTAPQTFTFAAADVSRQASLTLFVGSVDQNRPNQIKVTINGQTTTLVDQLYSNNGDQWDTYTLPLTIPTGATSVTVELVPTPVDNPLGGGASLAWITAALTITPAPAAPPPPPANPGTRTPGYWKNHPEAWPVATITLGGTTYTRDQAIALMREPTARDKTYNLAEHLIAAKLNVLVGNDDSCVAQAIAAADAFLAANPVGSGVAANSAAWKSVEGAFSTLGSYNEGKLCVPHADENSAGVSTGGSGNSNANGFTQVEKRGKKVMLRWQAGQLEASDHAGGPWRAVPNASNPADIPADGKMKFYRVR
jgi:hypothetical protein